MGKLEVGCGSPAWHLLAVPPCSTERHFLWQEAHGRCRWVPRPAAPNPGFPSMCPWHSLGIFLLTSIHVPSSLWEGAPQSVGSVFSLWTGEQGTHWQDPREPQGLKLTSLLSAVLSLKLALSRLCIMRNIFLSLWACRPWASLRL